MIACSCRSFIRGNGAWKLANVFISSNKPLVSSQVLGYNGYHSLNYLSNTMDRQKKQKTYKRVWRPISTQSSSQQEVVNVETGTNDNFGNGVQVQVVHSSATSGLVSDVGELSTKDKTSEGVDLGSSRVTNFEEEKTGFKDVNADTVSMDVDTEKHSADTDKHSVTVKVASSLIRFVKGKGGATQKQIEDETGVKIIFPSSKKENSIVIEGISVESVTKASEKIQVILDEVEDPYFKLNKSSGPVEAFKSPNLDYSHFISLPLAINPELVDKLINFQNSILGSSDSTKDENVGSESDGDSSSDVEDKDHQLDGGDVAVKIKVEEKNEDVKKEKNKIPLVSYPLKASSPSDLRINKTIFIKPKTFHLTVLMLKLWNEERVAAATEVLKKVSLKVLDALESMPVSVRLKGLECLRGSPAKARVLYTPVEVVGGEERLLHACQVITDAYVEAGLVHEKDVQKLKLHGTVMNVRHRNRSKQTKRVDSFDARGIIKQYGSEEWGEYLIPEVHLSQRFVFDENEYYHCSASIPLPGIKQL